MNDNINERMRTRHAQFAQNSSLMPNKLRLNHEYEKKYSHMNVAHAHVHKNIISLHYMYWCYTQYIDLMILSLKILQERYTSIITKSGVSSIHIAHAHINE